MAEHTYRLSDGHTLVLEGDSKPTPQDVFHAAEAAGVSLHTEERDALLKESNARLRDANTHLSQEELHPTAAKVLAFMEGARNSRPNRAVVSAEAAGPKRALKGVDRMAHGELAGGASDVIRGAGTTVAPFALPTALAVAPGATLLGVLGGTASAVGGETLASELGATPDQAALVGDLAGGVGGGVGGLIGSKAQAALPAGAGPKGLRLAAGALDVKGWPAKLRLAAERLEAGPKAAGLETAAEAVGRRAAAEPLTQVRPGMKAGKFTSVAPEATTSRVPYQEQLPPQPAEGLESPQDALARMAAAGGQPTPSGAATSRIPYTGPEAPPLSPNAGGTLRTSKAPSSLEDMLQSLRQPDAPLSTELPPGLTSTDGGRQMGYPAPKADEFGEVRASRGRAVSYTSGNPGKGAVEPSTLAQELLERAGDQTPAPASVASPQSAEAVKAATGAQPAGEGASGLPVEKPAARTGAKDVEPAELPADATRVEMAAELARRLGTTPEVDMAEAVNRRVAKSAAQKAQRAGRGSTPSPVPDGLSASELASHMNELRGIKPRPLDKLYGSNGPTPEQAAEHARQMKEWNRVYQAVSKAQKAQLEKDNAAFRARRNESGGGE